MMKLCSEKTRFIFLLFWGCTMFLNPVTLFAQHADHVPGDILVLLKNGSDVNDMVKTFSLLNGTTTGLKAKENLSQRLNIWQLHFDFSSVDENEMLNALSQSSEVLIAQFNHYVEL